MVSEKYFTAIKVVIIIFLFVVFGYKTFVFVDPDLGWHLRAGEIVQTIGTAPTSDPWTYTMPGHTWVDHEWLGDLFLWQAFSSNNWVLVQIFFTLLIVLPLAHIVWRARYFLELAFIGAASHLFLAVAGVRFQLFSIFFFYLFYLALYPLRDRKSHWLFAAPLFFACWANIHGGFVVALGFWSLVMVIDAYEHIRGKKLASLKLLAPEAVALVLSYAATLLTPYGIGLWVEIFEGTMNTSISYIAEWRSALFYTDPILATYFGAGGALIGFFFHTFDKKKSIPVILFLVSFLQHVRQGPFFFFTSLSLIAHACDLLYTRMRDTGQRMMMLRMDMVGATAMLLAFYFLGSQLLAPYTPAIDGIKALATPAIKGIPGNIFNDYGFGGWMIYEDPTRKVFIDGRGPHWKDESGYSAFEEYMDIYTSSTTWRTAFATHNINVAILGTPVPIKETNSPYVPKAVTDYIKNKLLPPPQISLADELKKDGWCVIYQDAYAVLLVRPGYTLCNKD